MNLESQSSHLWSYIRHGQYDINSSSLLQIVVQMGKYSTNSYLLCYDSYDDQVVSIALTPQLQV